MSFNVKVISTLNDKNAHEFSMFCDLCVMRMVRFRLKSFSCLVSQLMSRFLSKSYWFIHTARERDWDWYSLLETGLAQ